MQNYVPSRADVTKKIEMLLSDSISREEISNWAVSIITSDEINIKDKLLWDTITSLGAVDLPSTDRDYLYQKSDFESWISDLERH